MSVKEMTIRSFLTVLAKIKGDRDYEFEIKNIGLFFLWVIGFDCWPTSTVTGNRAGAMKGSSLTGCLSTSIYIYICISIYIYIYI